MRALTDECTIDHGDSGTVVQLRHRIPVEAGPPPAAGGACVVVIDGDRAVLSGDLDLSSADGVGEQIAAARIIDLTGVTYLDSRRADAARDRGRAGGGAAGRGAAANARAERARGRARRARRGVGAARDVTGQAGGSVNRSPSQGEGVTACT
jgi:hypothetical protein